MSCDALSLFFPQPALAIFEGLGGMEMILVAVIGLLLFGGKGLPDMARTFGKVIREFKKASSAVENEVRRVIEDEPAAAPPPRPTPRRLPEPVVVAEPASAPPPPGGTTAPVAVEAPASPPGGGST